MLLSGKNAVITGCNRGIGKAILKMFVQQGANVWAHARKADVEFQALCEQLARDNGVWVRAVYFDLANRTQISEGLRCIMADKQNVDILVNNAGVTHNAPLQMTTLADMDAVFQINYFAFMQITQYISKLMVRKKKGSIINIASTAAHDGNKGQSLYGGSKAAIAAATRSIASELADFNIRANAIAPGVTQTDMIGALSETAIAEQINMSCLNKAASPRDIANTAVFLASDLSAYINGQIIRVDGGL